jgi:hypothetical protein
LLLIVTHKTNITWGEDVATTLLQAPYTFLFILLIGLPGQFLWPKRASRRFRDASTVMPGSGESICRSANRPP